MGGFYIWEVLAYGKCKLYIKSEKQEKDHENENKENNVSAADSVDTFSGTFGLQFG
jgi:hypothetical protein